MSVLANINSRTAVTRSVFLPESHGNMQTQGLAYSDACCLASPVIPALRLYTVGAVHTRSQDTRNKVEKSPLQEKGGEVGFFGGGTGPFKDIFCPEL